MKIGKTEQEVVELIISLLRDNITDPATERASKGKTFIYDDIPRADITSTPRIGVYPVTSNYSSVGIGYSEQLEEGTIAVQIVTQKTDKFNSLRAEQLVDNLSKQIRDLIRGNHTYFVSNDVQHLVPETQNRAEVDGLVIENMTFKYISVN